MRQALSHLVNKQQIIDSMYKGIRQPANEPIVPGMWAYSVDIPSHDYSPDKAKQLLDAVGWSIGSDGRREMLVRLARCGFDDYVSLKWEKASRFGYHLAVGESSLQHLATYMRQIGDVDT